MNENQRLANSSFIGIYNYYYQQGIPNGDSIVAILWHFDVQLNTDYAFWCFTRALFYQVEKDLNIKIVPGFQSRTAVREFIHNFFYRYIGLIRPEEYQLQINKITYKLLELQKDLDQLLLDRLNVNDPRGNNKPQEDVYLYQLLKPGQNYQTFRSIQKDFAYFMILDSVCLSIYDTVIPSESGLVSFEPPSIVVIYGRDQVMDPFQNDKFIRNYFHLFIKSSENASKNTYIFRLRNLMGSGSIYFEHTTDNLLAFQEGNESKDVYFIEPFEEIEQVYSKTRSAISTAILNVMYPINSTITERSINLINSWLLDIQTNEMDKMNQLQDKILQKKPLEFAENMKDIIAKSESKKSKKKRSSPELNTEFLFPSDLSLISLTGPINYSFKSQEIKSKKISVFKPEPGNVFSYQVLNGVPIIKDFKRTATVGDSYGFVILQTHQNMEGIIDYCYAAVATEIKGKTVKYKVESIEKLFRLNLEYGIWGEKYDWKFDDSEGLSFSEAKPLDFKKGIINSLVEEKSFYFDFQIRPTPENKKKYNFENLVKKQGFRNAVNDFMDRILYDEDVLKIKYIKGWKFQKIMKSLTSSINEITVRIDFIFHVENPQLHTFVKDFSKIMAKFILNVSKHVLNGRFEYGFEEYELFTVTLK